MNTQNVQIAIIRLEAVLSPLGLYDLPTVSRVLDLNQSRVKAIATGIGVRLRANRSSASMLADALLVNPDLSAKLRDTITCTGD